MRRLTAGAACWLVQPAYVVVELLVALAASAAYSLRDDTISALGMLTCAPGHSGAAPVCSPAHVALDAAFVVFGLARAGGAVLLRPLLGDGPWGRVATALWVVSGVCAAAVGLAPVDVRPTLHAAVALPVFVLQPLALLATGVALRRVPGVPPRVATSGLLVGGVTLVAAVAFAARLGATTWVGGLERLALWPAYPWLAVAAAALGAAAARTVSRTVTPGPSRP